MIPKFRAWYKKYKKMMKVNQIIFEKKTVWLEDDNGDHENRHTLTREFKDVILMQYTGLKDANGVDIYEMDVIASQNKDRKNWHVSHHVVVWHDAGFMGKQICSSSYIGLEHWTKGDDGYVVIGNIHETPELLKEDTSHDLY